MMSLGTIEEFAGINSKLHNLKKNSPRSGLDVRETFDVICDTSVENKVVELALTIGPIDEKKFDYELLYSSHHALIVNDQHPLANRESISVKDLKDVPVAVLRDTTKTYQVFRDACQSAGF